MLGALLDHLPPYFLVTGSLTELRARLVARQPHLSSYLCLQKRWGDRTWVLEIEIVLMLA